MLDRFFLGHLAKVPLSDKLLVRFVTLWLSHNKLKAGESEANYCDPSNSGSPTRGLVEKFTQAAQADAKIHTRGKETLCSASLIGGGVIANQRHRVGHISRHEDCKQNSDAQYAPEPMTKTDSKRTECPRKTANHQWPLAIVFITQVAPHQSRDAIREGKSCTRHYTELSL